MPTDIYTLSGDIHTVEESYEVVSELLNPTILPPGASRGVGTVEFNTETEVTVYGDKEPPEDWYDKEDTSYTIAAFGDQPELIEKRTTYKYKTVVRIFVSSVTAWEPSLG